MSLRYRTGRRMNRLLPLDTRTPTHVVAVVSADEMRQRIKRRGKLKGRQVDDVALGEVRALLGEKPAGGWRRDLLIEHLHLLNDHCLGLHERHLVALARETNVPMAEVYEVATFYHHFEVLHDGEAAPALTVRVCDGLSCEMAGAQDLLQRLPALLGADVKVMAAPCVGRCERAPVAVVHQCPVVRADVAAVVAAVRGAQTRHPVAAGGASFTPALLAERSVGEAGVASADVTPAFVDYETYRAAGGYALAAEVIDGRRSGEDLIKALDDSGLRGLGGAGFPAGRKWRIVRDYAGPRLMAVNIDEGEPGTFKDRTYLERDPHRFLEGVLIAAAVVGIDACYLYLRDEYHGCRELLTAELATSEASPNFGNPLKSMVGTTDQWVNIVLRRAIRQAVEADADAIAIPSGKTVLTYKPFESFKGGHNVPKDIHAKAIAFFKQP